MIKLTRGKGSSKHSGTLIVPSIGPASAVTEHRFVECDAGARTIDGSVQTYADTRRTDETCNVGDLVKFLNIFIQCGARLDSNNISSGWLEWCIVHGKESDIIIPTTNLGTQTLGVIANRMFPNQVLLSGILPVGENQPSVAVINIKVPPKMQFLKFGDEFRVNLHFRTADSVETGVNNVRAIISYMYKAYQ